MRPSFDTTRPHPARMYDYFLGGKDNFAADRETAEQVMQSWSSVRTAARENRAFLGRAVRYLVREAGIRQFLDVGTGLPAANNVHEVAQAGVPECRVAYADNDPIVLAHARALDEVYRTADDLDWTYVSPAALIEPGERTGSYRTGGDQLLTDEAGNSRITIADYAIAIADVVESGGAVRRRITVAH